MWRVADIVVPRRVSCVACAAADMLKMLARKWKMHTQPGFWQTHQTRVQLALALRNFIKAKKL